MFILRNSILISYFYRQKEEEERRNKMAALATVRTAKAAVSVKLPDVVPEEVKELPSMTPKNGTSVRNDKVLKDV